MEMISGDMSSGKIVTVYKLFQIIGINLENGGKRIFCILQWIH